MRSKPKKLSLIEKLVRETDATNVMTVEKVDSNGEKYLSCACVIDVYADILKKSSARIVLFEHGIQTARRMIGCRIGLTWVMSMKAANQMVAA